jgi:hypothetical protein
MSKRSHSKRILRLELLTDELGTFLPFCSYQPHRGILKNNYQQTCENRGCRHYIKLRAESPTRRHYETNSSQNNLDSSRQQTPREVLIKCWGYDNARI